MIEMWAPAKLTVSFAITGTRDDGYHLIDAEMVTIDLVDRISISPADPTSTADAEGARPTHPDRRVGQSRITVTGAYAEGVPTDSSNVVAKALALCGRQADVAIDKRIPHGGGLGGGSTDAAAVLRWADYQDLQAASRIGADIPFCMVGGRARVLGIGEIVEPLPYLQREFTLVIPPLAVSTPAAYRAYDALDSADIAARGTNHLEPAAIAVVPELADWRDQVEQLCGARPVLAGSGATWFVEGRHGNALAVLHNEGAQILEVATTPGFESPAPPANPTD